MFGGILTGLRRYRDENGKRKAFVVTDDGRCATLAYDTEVRLTKEAA